MIAGQIGDLRVYEVGTIAPAAILCRIRYRDVSRVAGWKARDGESIGIRTAIGFNREVNQQSVSECVHEDGIKKTLLGKTCKTFARFGRKRGHRLSGRICCLVLAAKGTDDGHHYRRKEYELFHSRPPFSWQRSRIPRVTAFRVESDISVCSRARLHYD